MPSFVCVHRFSVIDINSNSNDDNSSIPSIHDSSSCDNY